MRAPVVSCRSWRSWLRWTILISLPKFLSFMFIVYYHAFKIVYFTYTYARLLFFFSEWTEPCMLQQLYAKCDFILIIITIMIIWCKACFMFPDWPEPCVLQWFHAHPGDPGWGGRYRSQSPGQWRKFAFDLCRSSRSVSNGILFC